MLKPSSLLRIELSEMLTQGAGVKPGPAIHMAANGLPREEPEKG